MLKKEPILTISSHDINKSIELIYNPPCPVYPEGHFDAYVRGKVEVDRWRYEGNNDGDTDLLYYAIKVCVDDEHHFKNHISKQIVNSYIDEHPSEAAMLITSVDYASQLKRGRALLRLDVTHPTRQMNQGEYVELLSCIDQALQCENVSPLAKVLAEYESESRSADENSPEHGTEMMTSPLSRDACQLFLPTGNSVEAEVYRQLVVERIHDGDVTTALKLGCIGHQIPLVRNDSNQPISDAQTLIDTFEKLLRIESYEQERSEFLSICDEWYRVLKPRGLMNIEQRELLREWISTRQYANTEDPIVSLLIEKCSERKKEEEEKKMIR